LRIIYFFEQVRCGTGKRFEPNDKNFKPFNLKIFTKLKKIRVASRIPGSGIKGVNKSTGSGTGIPYLVSTSVADPDPELLAGFGSDPEPK
jgi:hypothetical protein